MQIRGSTALITGGGRRVGRSISLALADAGADVVVHYNRSETDALATVKEASSMGVKAGALSADLVDPAQVVRLFDEADSMFGKVTILINNASAFSKLTMAETTPEIWDSYMAVNLRAPFLLAQAMHRSLDGKLPGKVVNLNDWRTARSTRFPYGVSKAALSGLTRSLAIAMAPNVQVNELALGAILPPADHEGAHGEKVSKAAPAGRMGTTGEVSQAILSLIENDFITGETIRVDGGRHIH